MHAFTLTELNGLTNKQKYTFGFYEHDNIPSKNVLITIFPSNPLRLARSLESSVKRREIAEHWELILGGRMYECRKKRLQMELKMISYIVAACMRVAFTSGHWLFPSRLRVEYEIEKDKRLFSVIVTDLETRNILSLGKFCYQKPHFTALHILWNDIYRLRFHGYHQKP